MDMASYHLSRKMLFFSGALFITLAIGVHLTPYFPSVTSFVSTVSSVVVFQNRCYSCLSHLHDLVWDVTPSLDYHKLSLKLPKARPIRHRQSPQRILGTLRPSSLLTLVLDSEWMDTVRGKLFKRHSDYQIVVDEIGMRLDFFWAG